MKYTYEDIDERIIKTKYALSDAVLKLIRTDNKIKVLDICHEANITPMTYYHHFHNKQQLLEFAIKIQLAGILPIPKKLKPINLKHFVYYLVFAFNKFVNENRQLIYCAIKQANEDKYLGSYIDLIDKEIKKQVKEEVKLLIKGNDIQIEFCTNIIYGAIMQLFKQIIVNNLLINSNAIWSMIKNVILNLQ